MNLSKILKRSAVVLMIAIGIVLIPTACTEEVVTNDSTSVSNSLTPASLAAPEITGKAFDGVNYITWKPVKNATGYRIYRDNVWIQDYSTKLDLSDPLNPIYPDDLQYYDYASLSSEIESIKDGQSYTYTVVATGVQASRGTNTSASNNTDFVMTDADILGDGIASVTITAKVPEVFSTVEAAKKVNVKYNGSIVGAYFEKPSYLFAGVSFAHAETGANVDVFTYLAQRMTRNATAYDPYATPTPIGTEGADVNYTYRLYMTKAANQYVWTPAYAGKYKYQIITAWPNAFYQNNTDVSGDVEIPALNVDAPEILAYDEADGILIRFKDTIGAEYTLYRAEEQNSNTAYEFTSLVTGNAWNPYKTTCEDDIEYRYLDKTVEYGKKYVYLLTGTKDGKALSFNSRKPSVAYQVHDTGFSWTPQFAAINCDGTVDLSWNVQEGITYKVLKCAIDIDPYSGNEVSHTEEYLTVDASKVAAAVNKVFVMSDTITKRETLGGYRYTLIGENAAKSVNKANEQIIAWYVTVPTFEITSITGRETNGNGIVDTVEVNFKAKKDIDMSKVKFYRAEVGKDNASTSAGYPYEFITEYTEITLTEDVTKRTDTDVEGNITYTYLDSSLTEADIATKYYVYAVAEATNNLSTAKTSTLCYSDITLPNFVVAVEKSSESSITYNIGWNAQYAATLSTSTVPLTPSAAIITVQTAKSNAPDITGVKEAEWSVPVTLKVNDFANDSTYNLDVSVTDSDLNYLYIKVLFTNAKYKVPTKDDMDNPINYYESVPLNNINYKGTVVSISNIVSTMTTGYKVYKNDTEDIDACVFTTSGKLNSSAYVVYVTWVSAAGAIIGTPQKLSANALYDVPDDATGHNNIANSYFVANRNSFYFITTPEDKTNVTQALVHITNTDGETLRSGLIDRWWTP